MVIILMGPAGAGKTTVGHRLAAALGWPFHDGDDFHPAENVARMSAGVPLGDAERASWLAVLGALVADSLARQASIVLACSALTRAYRRRLVPVGATPGSVRFVYLHVEPAVLEARLAARRGHYFGAALLTSQLATLEEPAAEEPAPVLTLDASGSVDGIVQQIRDQFGV